MFLNLQEVVPLSEDLFKFKRLLRRFIYAILRKERRWNSGETGGKSDQAGTVFGEKLFVDAWFVIEALGVGFRRESHEISVAFKVLSKQDQMKAGLLTGSYGRTIVTAAATYVSFTAEDGFNAVPLHRVVEGNCSEHIAVIRHGDGRHAQFSNAFGQRLNLYRAVQQAVVSM